MQGEIERAWLIATPLADATKAELLAKGERRKRVNNVLACLGKMLRYAREVELLDSERRAKCSTKQFVLKPGRRS